jgi:hypothetical protein
VTKPILREFGCREEFSWDWIFRRYHQDWLPAERVHALGIVLEINKPVAVVQFHLKLLQQANLGIIILDLSRPYVSPRGGVWAIRQNVDLLIFGDFGCWEGLGKAPASPKRKAAFVAN